MESAVAGTLELRACPACGRQNTIEMAFCPTCGAPQTLASQIGSSPTEPPPPPSHEADPLVGTVIAERYQIVSLIGRGGMGVVYKAEHVRMGKLMAIKLLSGELSRDKDTVKRFRREAEMASRLSHPNTVQIFDFGRNEQLMYLVMEYVGGKDLAWHVQHEGTLGFNRVARIAAQVCASAAEAHSLGVVHRDIKPENVMVVETRSSPDFVKVLDFGLAKLRDQDGGITRAGALVGTPYYMAPEMIRGESVDGRADLYAIGAMMYKCVAGAPPFTAQSPMAVLTKHLTDKVVPPSERSPRKDLPEECDALILRALEKDPANRFQSADEMREALLGYLSKVGEGFDSSTQLRAATPTPRTSLLMTSGRRAVEIATRGDVDRYEGVLRWRYRIGVMITSALVIAGIVAGGWAWLHRPAEVLTAETEPNDDTIKADALTPGTPVVGYVGRRISSSSGDVDVYTLHNATSEPRVFAFSVTGLPNIDLAVDVVRPGQERPVLLVDSTTQGGEEAAPNFPFNGSTLFLRVREDVRAGHFPTENVSDSYRIEWHWVTTTADDEREVNDTLGLANTIEDDVHRNGYIGWAGDVDVFCLGHDLARVRAVLDGVPGLDLTLSLVTHGDGDGARVVDEQGVGGREELRSAEPSPARQTCLMVRATSDRGGPASDPQHAYALHIDDAE